MCPGLDVKEVVDIYSKRGRNLPETSDEHYVLILAEIGAMRFSNDNGDDEEDDEDTTADIASLARGQNNATHVKVN